MAKFVIPSTILCLLIGIVGPGLPTVESLQCVHPPSVWCSDKAIAKSCQVEKQCEKWNPPTAQAPPVGVALYYESLCPGCREFIADQLYPTWQKLGNDVINITLVPYGNAKEQFVNNSWEFTCQHGVQECRGNILETCILYVAKDFTTAFESIHCMEASTDPVTSASQCCDEASLDFGPVSDCSTSSTGNKLEHQMGLLTEALDPPHKYTPWITLNGVHTDTIQEKAQSDLLSLVCDTYQGTPPGACSNKHDVCPK
uniref:Gamma-interferon-inducible lysosomal thiol reductase n=1 Tax=Stichopus monotuberculatus TaxID=576894 RepID=A0A097NUC0_STIMO|nr:gamma-interferon-inducible lysosomal thiol reductase [Stichopus monotuberculatus]